jgi:hypothetical protein
VAKGKGKAKLTKAKLRRALKGKAAEIRPTGTRADIQKKIDQARGGKDDDGDHYREG